MLRIKKIDAFGQVVLIAGFILLSLFRRDDSFIYGYFVVGTWQLVSMFFHLAAAKHMPLHVARKYYQKLVLGLAILGAAGVAAGLMLYFLFFLLYVSPFIAAWYAWFSNRELLVWQAKNLIHLKN